MNILKRVVSFFIEEKPSFSGEKNIEEDIIEEHKFCPYCVKFELTEKKDSGINIYICDQCSGFFLNRKDMDYFLTSEAEQDWSWLFWNYEKTEHTFSRSEESRKCPLCSVPMDNIEFKPSSSIWIDYCPSGHGIWLDGGEIKLIKDYGNQSE